MRDCSGLIHRFHTIRDRTVCTRLHGHGEPAEEHAEAREADEDLLPVAASQHARPEVDDGRDEAFHPDELREETEGSKVKAESTQGFSSTTTSRVMDLMSPYECV